MTEKSGFKFRQTQEIYLSYLLALRPAMESTQPPIQWIQEATSSSAKRPEREADKSPTSGAEIKNSWNRTSTFPYIFMLCLIKLAIILTFYIHLIDVNN